MCFKRILAVFFYAAVYTLFCRSSNGIAAEYPAYIPAVISPQETEYKPVQRDAQFEYELSLVAEKSQRDNPGEEQKYSSDESGNKGISGSASLNFMASHNNDGTLKDIEVMGENGNHIAHYEVEQKNNSSSVTLLSSDTSTIMFFLDKDTMTAKITKVKAAQGISIEELAVKLSPVITFMGYRLEGF